jgi:hypothetical protein
MIDSSQQFVVDAHGAVLDNDENAWKVYKAQRDNVIEIERLKRRMTILTNLVLELEKRIDEATSNR